MDIPYKDKLLYQMVFGFLSDSFENYEGQIGYHDENYCQFRFTLKESKVTQHTRYITEMFEIGYTYLQHTRVVVPYVHGDGKDGRTETRTFIIENQHDFDLFVDWSNERMAKFFVCKQQTQKRP